jgi:hypothetical protein
MTELKERLEKGAEVLANLDQKRLETGTPRWGYDTEYAILMAELWDLEEDILRDPGALEPQLVRVRRDPPSKRERRSQQ